MLFRLMVVERCPDVGLLLRCVLELHHGQRQSINEEHDIRPAVALALNDRELVHREEVVALWAVEVH